MSRSSAGDALTACVREQLAAVGAEWGGAAPSSVFLRWGPLLTRLQPTAADDYIAALELIYEGYLVHYREGRCGGLPVGEPEAALLCGDVFYARGLRLIAARGDVVAVALLTRLMASCASLRDAAAPFAADDALWAYAVGGLAALSAGAPPATVERLFDDVDAALLAGLCVDVRALARQAAPALTLADPAPLLDELRGDASPSAPVEALGRTGMGPDPAFPRQRPASRPAEEAC